MAFPQLQTDDIYPVIEHIRKFFPKMNVHIIVDVGAHKGKVARALADAFPAATVHAVEPALDNYSVLCSRLRKFKNVRTWNGALGPEDRKMRLRMSPASTANAIVSDDYDGECSTVDVDVWRGDTFSRFAAIDHINFLKVDTEGFDLEVLQGFEGLLEKHAIDIIQVEVGMNPENRKHIPIDDFTHFLYAFGYRIFGLYAQALEKRRCVLRRANVLFVSNECSLL